MLSCFGSGVAVFVGFPDAADRANIMTTIASQLSVSPQVLQFIPAIASCAEAELFTGADLQALMYSAQLEAAREAISKLPPVRRGAATSRDPEPDAAHASKPIIELRHLQIVSYCSKSW